MQTTERERMTTGSEQVYVKTGVRVLDRLTFKTTPQREAVVKASTGATNLKAVERWLGILPEAVDSLPAIRIPRWQKRKQKFAKRISAQVVDGSPVAPIVKTENPVPAILRNAAPVITYTQAERKARQQQQAEAARAEILAKRERATLAQDLENRTYQKWLQVFAR